MYPAEEPRRSRLLHGAGLAALAMAWFLGHLLAAIGIAHAGHEPAVAYLLALCTFLMASAGVALMVMGPRLFQRVIVADRWLPHIPATFHDEKTEDRT